MRKPSQPQKTSGIFLLQATLGNILPWDMVDAISLCMAIEKYESNHPRPHSLPNLRQTCSLFALYSSKLHLHQSSDHKICLNRSHFQTSDVWNKPNPSSKFFFSSLEVPLFDFPHSLPKVLFVDENELNPCLPFVDFESHNELLDSPPNPRPPKEVGLGLLGCGVDVVVDSFWSDDQGFRRGFRVGAVVELGAAHGLA